MKVVIKDSLLLYKCPQQVEEHRTDNLWDDVFGFYPSYESGVILQ